jgi:hypothetical protein
MRGRAKPYSGQVRDLAILQSDTRGMDPLRALCPRWSVCRAIAFEKQMKCNAPCCATNT